MKRSRQIDNRLESTTKVRSAALVHRDRIAEALAARAVEVEGPGTKASKEVFATVLDFMANVLGSSGTSLDEAEAAVVAERADDVKVRERRDAACELLVARMVRVRSNVQDALGEGALALYGLAGATPRGPREAVSHARNVAMLMQEQPFHVTVDGVTYDSEAIAAAILDNAADLGAAVEELSRQAQALSNKLGLRERVALRWADDYQGAADSLTGLFRMGGRKDLSERVRPTSRTLSGERVAEVEEAKAEPQGGAASGGEPGR
jgi:hypothetical protein